MFKASEIAKITSGKFLKFGEASISSISIDTRTLKKGALFIAIKGERLDGHNFIKEAVKKGACAILVNGAYKCVEDIKLPVIRVRDTVRALGNIARAWRDKFEVKIVAVTGYNGKTTTKDLIAHILSSKYKVLKNPNTENNHIGVPLALLRLDKHHEIAVLELGSNHFGEINYLAGIVGPDVGIITNIGESHLEHFLNKNGVYSEKTQLLENLNDRGIILVNRDDKFLGPKLALRPFYNGNIVLSFGLNSQSDFMASDISFNGVVLNFRQKNELFSLRTFARHNIYNGLAAISCAKILGLRSAQIKTALKTFDFPKGRFNLERFDNVKLIDDSYNANPLSLSCAIDAFKDFPCMGRKIMVLADMLELGKKERFFHEEAGRLVRRSPVDILVCIGKRARHAARAAILSGLEKKNCFSCRDNQEARIILNKILSSGDVALFKGSRAMRLEGLIKNLKEDYNK